jgi:hypothetical protein
MLLVIAAMWLLVRKDAPRKNSPGSKKSDDFDEIEALN